MRSTTDISFKGFLSVLYFALLIGFSGIAILGLFNESSAIAYANTWYVTFPIGIKNTVFSLVAKPYSLILFSAFGIPLYFRFNNDPIEALLMLGFSYVTWELVVSISAPFLRVFYPNAGGAGLFTVEMWLLVAILSYILVKPVINFNTWITIAVFVFYINIVEIDQGVFLNLADPQIWNVLELMTIVAWNIFILKIARPRHPVNDPPFVLPFITKRSPV